MHFQIYVVKFYLSTYGGLGYEENMSKELICLGILQKSENSKVTIANITLNIIFSVTATLENLLVLVTIWRSPNLQSPSNTLLCGLAISDLCIGLLSEPLFIGLQVELLENSLASCVLPTVYAIISTFFAEITLFTVTAISIDRYLAIHFHLRYAEVVTEKKAMITVFCFWLISGLHSVTWNLGFVTFCEVVAVIGTLCLVAVSFTWIKIYRVMRLHQAQIQDQMNAAQGHQFNMVSFRKSVANTMIILFIVLICHFPYLLSSVIIAFNVYSPTYIFVIFINSLMLVNSSVNPLLYCWRYRDIRAAAKHTLLKLCCQTHGQ